MRKSPQSWLSSSLTSGCLCSSRRDRRTPPGLRFHHPNQDLQDLQRRRKAIHRSGGHRLFHLYRRNQASHWVPTTLDRRRCRLRLVHHLYNGTIAKDLRHLRYHISNKARDSQPHDCHIRSQIPGMLCLLHRVQHRTFQPSSLPSTRTLRTITRNKIRTDSGPPRQPCHKACHRGLDPCRTLRSACLLQLQVRLPSSRARQT